MIQKYLLKPLKAGILMNITKSIYVSSVGHIFKENEKSICLSVQHSHYVTKIVKDTVHLVFVKATRYFGEFNNFISWSSESAENH